VKGSIVQNYQCPDGGIYSGETDLQIDKNLNETRLPCGNGHKVWPDGSKYEGEFYGGSKDGVGIFKYSNGDVYSGQYKDDKREGRGKYTHSSGQEYEGLWENDTQHG
jgi:hypothetical protein